MRIAALALLGLLVQESNLEKEIVRLAERLSDDKIDIRDQARLELLALGTVALPLIRRRAETAELEARERLLGIVREIERQERVKFFLREPRRIRLRAERMAVGDVLKELARQSETPVVLKEVSPEEPVTVEIRDLAFFEALREICLAHGSLVLRLPDGTYTLEHHAPVELVRGNPKACRPFVQGPFVVSLESVYITRSTLGPKKETPHGSLVLVAGWERGIRPTQMKLQVTSVVDEQGTVYQIHAQPEMDRMDIYIQRSEYVSLVAAPPASVTTFREISGTVEFEFPSDGYVARIERPMGQKRVEAAGGPASFTLQDMARQDPERVRVTLDSGTWAQEDVLSRTRFFAIDGRDRIYPQQGGRGKGTAAGRMRWTCFFDVPVDVDVKELRAVKIKLEKDHPVTVKFPWKLENVRFK
jgi:hypothetical protein